MSIATRTINKGDTVRCPGGTAEGQPRPDLNDQIGKVVEVNGGTRKAEVIWPRGRVYYDGQQIYNKKGQPFVSDERVRHDADELVCVE